MDPTITVSARLLAHGDVIGSLKYVALRNDPPALALRGIAMARLGEYPRAHELLRRARRGFGAHDTLARARCTVAQAEVALAMREFDQSPRHLTAAATVLDACDDRSNAALARLIAVRRSLLLGRLDHAATSLAQIETPDLPPLLLAIAALAGAELAMRSLRIDSARIALERARDAAARTRIPALLAEVAQAHDVLAQPAARLHSPEGVQALRLDEVATLLASESLIIDACRRQVGVGTAWISLARRPVLFTLALALGQAWPGDVDRDALIARTFRTRHPDESHRARLRVEIGRLRNLVADVAQIHATARGFALKPHRRRDLVILAPPVAGDQGALLALLSDGAAWSTSALARAMGISQRTVQRALAELEAAGRVRALGRSRAQRWLAPTLTGFTTVLLLPTVLPGE